MIKLLEHEGKTILTTCGVTVPLGGLYRALPEGLDGPLVVKAQVFSGGRGKAGGVRFAEGRGDALRIARELASSTLGDAKIEDVYIEQRLAIDREFYLAALVDRDLGIPVMLASADGGVDIEAVPPDRIVRQSVDPLIGLQPFMVERLVRGLKLTDETAKAFGELIEKVYAGLLSQDAELIEINPLVLTKEGTLVAADAKMILDEDAAFRHPGRRSHPDGTAFEREARSLGVIGVEIGGPGGVAAIMNGAGLTMATLDEVIALGGKVSGVVELHGATMHGPDRIADVIACVLQRLEPAVILVNIHFHFRSLETIADGVLRALKRLPALKPDRLVLRLRGEREAEAVAALSESGLAVLRDFGPACVKSVELARRASA